ncbi:MULTISPECIES: HU family DNA-binding protein [unclassified Aurantimonas]|nr:HU family DNA-binding protein [Aurantimonas sp. A3-2-R12]
MPPILAAFFLQSPRNRASCRCRRRFDPRRSRTVLTESLLPKNQEGILMNKNELVSAVAEKSELSKQQASSAVDAVFEAIQGTMAKGDDIRLVGFGTFSVSHRAASKGRNPSTGAEVDIPARNVPKFAAGKGLKDAVNNR